MIRTLAIWLIAVGTISPAAFAQKGTFPVLRHKTTDVLRIEISLRKSIKHLAGTIGERNLEVPAKLDKAADWIAQQWSEQGLSPRELAYEVGKHRVRNLEVHVSGPKQGPIVLVGAHYDSVEDCPGADDNASGVAVMLEISKALAKRRPVREVRCVAFTNEEPPYFMTELMGSRVYAKMCREKGETIQSMISLETMGYFKTTEGSQRYPPLLSSMYPSTGHFIGIAGDLNNRAHVTQLADLMRKYQTVPVESASFPGELPGISWSDHASFWNQGYPGVMVTDTAPYRNPNYHQRTDTPATIDYQRLACITAGLIDAIGELAGAGAEGAPVR